MRSHHEYDPLQNSHDPSTSARRSRTIAFLFFVACAVLSTPILYVPFLRGNPGYHSFEEAAVDLTNLIEYHYWRTGQVPTGLKDIEEYFQGAHMSYQIDFDVTWSVEIPKILDSRQYTSVTYTFSKGDKVETIDSTLHLRRAANSWSYVELYNKGSGRYEIVKDPINVAHAVAYDVYATWHSTKILPGRWSTTTSPPRWPGGARFAPKDFRIRKLTSQFPLSFQIEISDGTVIRYDFSAKVIEAGGEPIVRVTRPPTLREVQPLR